MLNIMLFGGIMETICTRHVMLFAPKILFSDCRVAVVLLRTFTVRSGRPLPH